MNNSLNLASKPFSNRILPWALTAIILFVSLIGLVFVIRLTTNARNEAGGLEAEIVGLKTREHAALEAAKKLQQELSADQKQALPAAHALVDRKMFSWSKLLADLEGSLPDKVKVTRIAVRDVTRQGDQTVAQLDLAVFSKYAHDLELVIHAAAQPSHDWAANEPTTDFTINANGTLNLLEAARRHNPSAASRRLSEIGRAHV